MDIITIDVETYWSADHTLAKLNAIEYVCHALTEIQMVAIKKNGEPTQVYQGPEVRTALSKVDWANSMVTGHNLSGFDCMILAWRYGVRPKLWNCTLAMARPIYGKICGLSLKALAEHLNLGVKDNTALVSTKGKYLKEFTVQEIISMVGYNAEDVELTYKLFKHLGKMTPARELKLIDLTIRMLTEPKFEIDTKLLNDTLLQERQRKTEMVLEVARNIGTYNALWIDDLVQEATRKVLASPAKFSEVLTYYGVPIPMKQSPTNPEKQIPALAKSDDAFVALQSHPNPIVAAAAQARLGVKSTILETRIELFLKTAGYLYGRLPVPLSYYGAETTGRWSGQIYNMQNLPRIGKKPKPSDALRNSLRAPKGYKIVVVDLSGIEMRINMFLWQVQYAMDLFIADPENADLYRYFAANYLYECEESAVTDAQRQIGKISHLGLGFGAGPATFQRIATTMGGVDMDEEESKKVVYTYRDAHNEITKGWRTCHDALQLIYMDSESLIDPWGLCRTVTGGIKTPLGMIRYPNLHREVSEGKEEWWYGQGRSRARIYAGKVTENIVQHLGREILSDSVLEIKKATGYGPVNLVHDEWVGIIPDVEADHVLSEVLRITRTPPKWWPELVVWSKGGLADTYGEAK